MRSIPSSATCLHGRLVVRLIGGRYELADRIGGGGMADVFRAHDRTLDRDVALKLMRPAFATDPEFVERFHREAEAMSAIEHPNVLRVLDYGAGHASVPGAGEDGWRRRRGGRGNLRAGRDPVRDAGGGGAPRRRAPIRDLFAPSARRPAPAVTPRPDRTRAQRPRVASARA